MLSLYAANTDPYGADRRTQAPMFSVEAHLTRNLPHRVWLSADVLYRDGGSSRTDGVDNHDPVHGWPAGGTAAVPLPWSASLALTFQHVVKRWDAGPDGWWFRTALIAPF